MIPEGGSNGMVGTGIYTGASGNGCAILDSKCDGKIIKINNNGNLTSGCALEEPNASGMTLSFNNVDRIVTIIRTKIGHLGKRNMSFKNNKKSRVILSDHVFQMSSGIIIVSPSDIPRED